MLCVAELLSWELLPALPQERLNRICNRAIVVELGSGKVLLHKGEPPRGFFILLCGRIGLTRHSDGIEISVGQQEALAFFVEVPV